MKLSKNAYIFGSGFGLYGFLPALVKTGYNQVGMSIAYKDKLLSREDLSPYINFVKFREFEEFDFEDPNLLVVFAKRPEDQSLFISKILNSRIVSSRFIFEKPFTEDPNVSIMNLIELGNKNIRFRIDYIMHYCSWYPKLDFSSSMEIDWKFKAHHFQNNLKNWKSRNFAGGGVLKFFGIHLLYLFLPYYSNLSEVNVIFCDKEFSRIQINIINPDGRNLSLNLDSNSEQTVFQIKNSKEYLLKLKHPFEIQGNSKKNSKDDPRVFLLIELIKEIEKSQSKSMVELYIKTEELLLKIEESIQAV